MVIDFVIARWDHLDSAGFPFSLELFARHKHWLLSFVPLFVLALAFILWLIFVSIIIGYCTMPIAHNPISIYNFWWLADIGLCEVGKRRNERWINNDDESSSAAFNIGYALNRLRKLCMDIWLDSINEQTFFYDQCCHDMMKLGKTTPQWHRWKTPTTGTFIISYPKIWKSNTDTQWKKKT